MRFRSYKKKWRRTLILVLGVPTVLYFVWLSGHVVIAFQEEKRAHIFPTVVTADGWGGSDLAIAQDLPSDAPFASFTKQNSAFISIQGARSIRQSGGVPVPSFPEGVTEESASDVPVGDLASSTPSTSAPTPDAVDASDTEVVPDASTEAPAAQPEEPASKPVEEESAPNPEPGPIPPTTSTDSTGSQPADLPTESAPTQEVSAPAPEVPISMIGSVFQKVASFLFSKVIAQEIDEVVEIGPSSTPAIIGGGDLSTTTLADVQRQLEASVPDVATCTVLAKECHTIEFSGFSVEGLLTEKKLNGVELNFSFASLASENQVTDGKLLVRYHHQGSWRSAGEIFLNKELSNGANGGYFSSILSDLRAWDDLSDVRVVVEYVHGDDDSSAEIFLDAVWLDAIHSERIQNVISGDVIEIPADAPENVAFSLGENGAASSQLVLQNGETISFPFQDGFEDTLTLRVDRDSYIARVGRKNDLNAVVYASVTNIGSQEDSFRLYAAFESGKGEIGEISQFFRNVASTTETEIFDDVTYLCESGWLTATSTSGNTCLSTGEVRECSWINESGNNCLVENVRVGVDTKINYESTWIQKSVSVSDGDPDVIEMVTPGYSVSSETDEEFTILPGQTVYFRIVLNTKKAGPQQFALVAYGEKYSGNLDSANLKDEKKLSAERDEKLKRPVKERVNQRISTRTEFDGDELPEFRFKFKTQRGAVMRALRSLMQRSNTEFSFKEARMRAPGGGSEKIPVDVEYGENGEWKLNFKKHPHSFRPGKYSVELTVTEGSVSYTDTYDFYWGVLAVNTDKSVYSPSERAWLQMAALDDVGSTICDATLELVITDPNGSSQMLPVQQSGKCGPNNVIDVPDYSADYTTGVAGDYQISLTELGAGGQVIHHIADSFTVREDVPFDVQRVGPTRIYPLAPYTMEITIRAKRAFSGSVTETMPLGFLLPEKGGGTLSQYGGALHLTWGVTLAAGQEKRISYTFDAPDISPYVYILGPLAMNEGNSRSFEEVRTWKIASDALGSYVEKNSSWSPTVGGAWEAKDLSGSPFSVPANAVLEIAVVNSDVANEAVGGVRHASSSLTRTFNIHEAEPQGTTQTVVHVQASATSSIQTFAANTTDISFVLLGYWTNGYYVERFDQIDPGLTDNTWGNINLSSFGVASSTVAEMVLGNWNANAERNAGVRNASSTLSRLANIHESEAGGVNTATMFVQAKGNGIIQGFGQVEGANDADVDYWLVGYWSVNPTGLNYTERFDDLGGPASNSTWTDRTLSGFAVPATGIAEVLYANAADANLSQLLGVRTDGSAIDRSFNIHEAETGGWSIGRAHVKAGSDANATIEYFTDDTVNGQFRLLGYWSSNNYPANAPTLYDVPFESEKTGSSTPTIRFSTTDPDGASDIVYQIQWDDDSILDDAPIGDRISSNESGCSPNCFQDLTSADTSPFTEGDLIEFKIQTALVSGTTYYWRVRANDVSGSGIDSEWSETRSFTYVANTDPKQWFQTEDAQFDTGTLSSAETNGANSVELVATAPTGALIAYGTSVDNAPRYRIWDGSAWGTAASASDVGGTIQWMSMKAGTTRNEYVLGTQDALSDVNVQVYNGGTGTWGNLQEVTATISDTTARGFDIAYESSSGDALVVYCDGDADPSYYVWNGSTWTLGTSPINLTSANNCEWIKLASDPTSDEIILVTRDTAAGATDYEAQVWDGSAWGNATTLGGMTDVLHEGISVEYEESGDQAVVVVSNGDNGNFSWVSWNGAQWSTPVVNHAIGDDFEWGVLRRDDGSDSMALCYVDQDDDMGTVRWDGTAWATWATTDEFELTSNIGASGLADGRPLSCEFETTVGRDGYIMIPYSDTVAGRYQAWTGASYSGEASISTVQDSWTVGSIRTGDGKILSYFHDDVNGRYDFSYWNSSAWSTLQTLENAPSDTTEPFSEPISMAAQIFQASEGSIMSDAVSFSAVPGQPTWGEALWNTTEPSGTDVVMQVYYATSTATCADASYALVPEGAGGLTGNAAGFDETTSPLDLTGLSTTTYPKLCLKATLSSTNSNVPALDDWTISWTRQPYLTQQNFYWYVNAASLTPTDPWPSGATNIAENEAIPVAYAPSPAQVLRLRMSILDENVAQSSSDLSLRLQYAEGLVCSASMTWLEVGAVGSTTAAWRGYDNGTLTDGTTLPSTLISTADTVETYEEQNDSSLNPNSIAVDNEGEWDWVLEHNTTDNTGYCFRAVTSEGELLNAYSRYPSLITNSRPSAPNLDVPFNNEQVASTTPFFEFSAQDTEGNDVTYQIQIDDTYSFTSTVLDRDSQNNDTEFENIITPADKDPFTSEQTVRFIPTTALTNNTTYYWRVRAKDRNASNTWSDWSDIRSITIDTSTTVSTWYQTMMDQFATDDFDQTEATSTPTHEVVLTPPLTVGTTTSTSIDFDWHTSGNAWGSISWTDVETLGTLTYHVEYLNGATWELIPDADLGGNSAGFGTSPVSIAGLDQTTYNQIRLRANFVNTTGTPRLQDWKVAWGTGISQATSTALFDNEKTGTSTPTFKFSTIDPEADDLVYEISWSTSQSFTSSTTFNSASTGFLFSNLSSTTDSSPFQSGGPIQFTVPTTSPLINGNTYWWRVRARDPSGSNINSVWSALKSFTYDSTVAVSTWFQTTDEQFDTDTLSDIQTTSNTARISTVSREAFTAYAEGTVQTPMFRVWNGTTWSDETSGVSVDDSIRFVETAAAPTRDEYVVVTEGSAGNIYAQVFNGVTDTAGNMLMMGTSSNALRRSFDVAYETTSGDAMVVTCAGSEAAYHIWNGSAWSATSSITLAITSNCEWIQLASDPTSDEIVMVVRDATTGTIDYQALVWNGTGPWANPTTLGSQANAADEGMAIEYEESGGDAVFIAANGINNSFVSKSWNGSVWSATSTVAVGNDFAGGRIARDAGTDKLALCYIDIDNDLGLVEWDGAAWGATNEFETAANNFNGRPVSCQYETLTGRDGNIMIPYSDDLAGQYQYWTGASFSGEASLTTISDSWELRSARTGDDNILTIAYDDANTEYDFTYWNGTSWSTEEVLETASIPTVTPATIPFDIVARRFQTITSGTITSSSIVFTEGLGPKWGSASWSDTTPGSSNILYQVEYFTSTSSWTFIPDAVIPGNSVGTTTTPIDLTNISFSTYGTLRLKANLSCSGADCPTLSDWSLLWSEGVHATGTAKQFDQTTNITSGSVAVAVNGVLQIGKTASISAGVWDIPNITAFAGDVITIFINGASDSQEAVAVTVYDGSGDMGGMQLFERHLTLGSSDNPTVTNANIGAYDNSVSGDEDIFYDVDAGNDLSVCRSSVTGCYDTRLLVNSGTTYRPDSASSGNVTGRHVQIDGTLVGDGNTFTLSGSWDNNNVWTANSSTVVFSATSTTESLDSTGASSHAFNNVTFGSGASTATWSLISPLNASSTLSINSGTLALGASAGILLSGDLSIGASGLFQKNTSATTFIGSGTNTWTDNSAGQDLGTVVVDGSAKTVNLTSGVRATDITIGADDTLSANGSNGITIFGNWTNNNVFTAGSGTVTFAATTTGKIITPGQSSFYNITFNGGGGNWSFTSATATSTNDFTITRGTVTLTTGTTTVGGSFVATGATGGVFLHNNGTLLLNATTGGKSIQVSTSTLRNLTMSGSGGAWAFLDSSATTTNNFMITAGTLTAPSVMLEVGGSFSNSGTFTPNNGTVKMSSLVTGKTVTSGSSSFYNLIFNGSSGTWIWTDTNATTTRDLTFQAGTTTLPSGTLAVGGSFINSNGFLSNGGTVKFTATTTGFSITPANSTFYDLLFDAAAGGWTITGSATSTNNATITNANSLTLSSGSTLEVAGTFTNSVGGAATTWTGSILYLRGAGTYSLNTKTNSGDAYGTLLIGTSTKISMWNSSATVTRVDSTGYLYSQDHAGNDGSLYIYGAYTRSSNSEYWSYATDFDGTSLAGGSERQVHVKIATSSSLTFSGGNLNIVGTSTATTTIANQGVGSYDFSVTGGTLNALYYQIASTTAAGLSLSGTPTITSLNNGSFTLSASGTMMTVASTVIDLLANNGLQIYQVSFDNEVATGANVVESGNATSFWWFRDHYGNYDGEQFDNDPSGNPGDIQWDDSGYTVTLSGTVYSGHGSGPSCLGAAVVTAVINGVTPFTGSCNSGVYSIPNVSFTANPVITVYIDGGSGKAVTVTRTATGDVTDLDLYQNAVIVRSESNDALTIANLVTSNDYSDDTDLMFTASGSSLTVKPDNELYVWNSDTFVPGGDVTLQSGGSGDARDGRLYIDTNAVFTAAGTESHSIGGGLFIGSGATFTAANSTLTFTATTTGKTISTAAAVTLYDVVFNGSGGGWSLSNTSGTATTTVNTLAMTAGTLSGTGDMIISTGGLTGSGVITMTGGEFRKNGTGNFAGSNPWQFSRLTFGSGSAASTTKTGAATTTVTGILRIASNHTLNAGNYPWVLTGGGTPFTTPIAGTLNAMGAPFWYTGVTALTVANANYAALFLEPSGAGSPTYTLAPGAPTIGSLTIGDGVNPVTVTADTNDPSIDLTGSILINSGSTYIAASNVAAFLVRGDWINNGTFSHSNGTVSFGATATGKTITPGSSTFYDLEFVGASGGWTITGNATSTNNTTITNASSLTLASGATLEVGGTFTNSVADAATTWTGSTLYLNSGTSYSLNLKTDVTGDDYGTLRIGASTHVRMWHSSSTAVSVASSGSLYSQDHAEVNGGLNIWGAYTKASGSDYWSYATDFDGTALGGSPRQVDVRIASSSTITLSGGVLDILGISTATTTIQTIGGGRYAFAVSGGTLNANYYSLRDTDANGLNISGTPTITSLSFGDYELSTEGGTSMTVAHTVINANPLKIFTYNRFATSTGVTSGSSVTSTGSASSFWKFNLHYGNYDGEAYDNDPDPGYIRWDDSNDTITVSGNVYTNEGSGVSSVCTGANVVRLKAGGLGDYFVPCDGGTGAYSIPGVSFNPGDTLTVYLDTDGGVRAANITIDPSANISGVDLYENRVIVRHEDSAPITIVDMSVYDSDEDTDIPYDATDAATDTLIVQPDTKLIVWNGKTFAPAGNVTLESGGSGNSYDGSLQLFPSSTFFVGADQSHSIGGGFTVDAGATLINASSTFTFTATTTGKTITMNGQSFYDVVFNGIGGNWAFSGAASTTNNFTIAAGTVTLSTATTTVGGSFLNTGGTFMHNNGTLALTATTTGKTIRTGTDNTFYNLLFNGTGGGWSFFETSATSSNNFTVQAGTVTAPSTMLTVGGSFSNAGTFTHNSATVKMTAVTAGKTIQMGTSDLYDLTFNGSGGTWSWLDTNASTTNNMMIQSGTTTLPSGILNIGGSLSVSGTGAFAHNSGTVRFNATAIGKSIAPSTSNFYNLLFDSSSGGWTLTANATSTNNTTITSATSLTIASGATLEVDGTFTNSVGGGATTWTGSTLHLNSGTTYSINTKTAGGDLYGTLLIGASTKISSWDSSAEVTTVNSTGSLYSQDHAGTSGALNIYGAYTRSTGTDYWSRATDFDGTDISGSPRTVNVRIATSSSVTLSGGTLNIIGTATATTTIAATYNTGYSFDVTGGTLNANYYQFRNLDSNGLEISGTPSITSLSYGDFELAADGGTLMKVAYATINANVSLTSTGVRFATSTGITSGYNVTQTGTVATNAWFFTAHYGNLAGESYDTGDGANPVCGSIRWDDSDCQLVTQEHYRWRNDDGGEGAPTANWYNASWSKRKRIGITNPNATTYTNIPVKIDVVYDADMQGDFDDLRFTDSSGTTTLSYWIESTAASASSTVWVEVPSLPSSGSAIIYVYYGNGAAASAADGVSTFKFFDDFEDNNITEYTNADSPTVYFETNTSFNHNWTYGLGPDTSPDQRDQRTTLGGIYRTGSLTAQGDTIRFYQYVDNVGPAPAGGTEDEPCVLFGVGGLSQNYAVCLDNPTDKVKIVRDVESDDDSGVLLASTTMTYSTGWHEIKVDWLTSNEIYVKVYNSAGTQIASVSATTSLYTSGGMGFTFWGMYGGWDFYSVKQYTASDPTYVFGLEQSAGGATWKAAEDTSWTSSVIGEIIRLRFNIQNTAATRWNQLFRLQVAPKGGELNCESVSSYTDVPTDGACGSTEACMAPSSYVTNQDSTTGLLTYPASFPFSAGSIVASSSNQTASSTVASNAATEVEYVFKMTSNAIQDTYCFRAINGATELNGYTHVAELNLEFPPSITNFKLNNQDNIILTEGTSTYIYATATTTDTNGYADIISATSTIYRSSVAGGPDCAADNNNCYQIPASSCTFSSCSGNVCSVSCRADIQYFADPTDASSTATWLARISVVDSTSQRDTETVSPDIVELQTLRALSVTTGDINYGTLAVGADTGSFNATTTTRNTGNSNMDVQVGAGAGGTIPVATQKFATTTFVYASCSVCQALTAASNRAGVNIAKPTSTSTAVTQDISFGISIPVDTPSGTLTGTNEFSAVAPGG